MKRSFYFIPFLMASLISAVSLEFKEKNISPTQTDLTCTFVLQPHELLYQKNIVFSVDNPAIQLSPAQASKEVSSTYDSHFKEHCMVYDGNVTFSLLATLNSNSDNTHANIHVLYATNTNKEGLSETFPLSFSTPQQSAKTTPVATETKETQPVSPTVQSSDWRAKIQQIKDTVASTDSWLIRFLAVFLLGLLLSLTPCIYPMIPITVGILQAQGSNSLSKNFLLSACYTLGLSTTFALMGLLAASSGAAFGHLLVNPIFVVAIVALLCYFAFSLFGFYNMYIPAVMRNKSSMSRSGSALSIFTFGLASGTFASPCVSPGLALVLALVAAIGNKFLGFLLLFVFGIGMSTPLLLIGTFSSSMNMLPRAGMWMIEIQRIFGFLLLGMCFYYLNTILPSWLTACGLSLLLIVAGVYYLHSKHADSRFWKFIKNILGIGCLAGAVFIIVVTVQDFYYPELKHGAEQSWYTDLAQAEQQARAQSKKVFIDFWTPYCSICKAITNTVLKDPSISAVLDQYYTVLTVNASDHESEPYKTLHARYSIQGVPTLIIIDPTNNAILKRWSSELYDMDKTTVINELTTLGQIK